MGLDGDEQQKRSVDSLQRIFTMVIALALGQAIQSMANGKAGEMVSWEDFKSGLPQFIAFISLLVPFYHGMNSHLDYCYLKKKSNAPMTVLILDFFVFFIEGAIFYTVALVLKQELRPFQIIGALLLVDSIWALISSWIHYGNASVDIKWWSGINAFTIVIGYLIDRNEWYSTRNKQYILMMLLIARTAADYAKCWPLYFPRNEKEA